VASKAWSLSLWFSGIGAVNLLSLSARSINLRHLRARTLDSRTITCLLNFFHLSRVKGPQPAHWSQGNGLSGGSDCDS
jgi:hypothetical protein